ncbi:hypothetical protein L226DRAFT_528773 [Lentinus tigrinus ALCF2SS1-7]|uniref:uncharacterized protein n=1 Tax=Lentinus tigrinus ALCF2SS1-7 TaxID=1328758 RepID=UPI0011662D12|nr:hypothetical protein L226DRAFT_528773 [Lentinus tigrinus ALCF2SS1-7]
MRFTVALPLLALAGLSFAVPAPDPQPITAFLSERALPSGHPVIDNSFLSENGLATGYTIKTNIYPSGFSAPTEPITALPSGYSVAWNGVFDPEGSTVSFFPSSVLESVIAESTTTSDPGAPSATPTTPTSSGATASASTTAAADNGASLATPSLALALVAIVMTFMA